ncbi:hypothetical protein [Deinococcus arenicola]|uniref:Uncharacterized protein n=1 Tax=Deinococcus arenicola TaxID=2994950 RepID=A0ABU4DLA6_9DEIO|nr:hypothetical protein [Deinococcus sp. ZS9-10]MDV6373218.1 hypothetical protein [Deinococcus sp. ZS9-10]
MTKLFNNVCDTLEALPIHYNGNRLEIIEEQRSWFFGVDRYDVAKSLENTEKFLKALRMEGFKGNIPRFSKIAEKRKALYESVGWKYVEEFMDYQRLNGGTLLSLVLIIGDKPLYRKSTTEMILRAVKKVVKDCPAYWKIERNDSLENKIHVHILILVPDGFVIPKTCNKFPVLVIPVGSKDKYKDKTMYENTRDFMYYLLKPSDGRASFKVKAHYTQMYLEWWEEMLVTEDGKPTWESPDLRGELNLDIKWLKGFNREEMESRYEPSTISTLEENKTLLEPVPHDENRERGEFSDDVPLDITQSVVNSILNYLDVHPPCNSLYSPKDSTY